MRLRARKTKRSRVSCEAGDSITAAHCPTAGPPGGSGGVGIVVIEDSVSSASSPSYRSPM